MVELIKNNKKLLILLFFRIMFRSKVIVFCSLMVNLCWGWKIRHTNVSNLDELKTKCSLACPFQKQIANLYMDDITCEIDCKIEHCVKGCRFMETALETECESLCNISHTPANSNDIFCFIGCKQSLLVYFESIKQEISNLEAPTLVEHTLSTTSLTLEWNEPTLANETFMLQCRFVDTSNEWQFCQNQMWISTSVVNVQTLQPYTKYQFRVALRLTPGDWYDIFSEPSSIIATLPEGIPISPPNIQTATPVSHNIISVIWEEGEFTNGPILSYILQINELPVGYAAVKDVVATRKVHSYMLKNLQASTSYHITISARNSAGLGPPAAIVVKTRPFLTKSKEKVDLMVATEHSVYSISSDVQEEPVLMYNSTHVIKGIALHVHRELLFISDSSGSIIVTSSKGLLTPQELSIPPSSKPSALTIDWLGDHLYILNEILHPSGSIVYQVARCGLDGSNLVVVVSGFIMKPHHIEVDPYNGYLFWVVRGVGLYRLDLIDISKVINRNVSPELILDDANLGAFLVNCDQFRIIIHVQTEVISISLDGQDAEKFCDQNHEVKFQNIDSLTMAGGSLFSTDGEHLYQDVCDSQRDESFVENITNKLSMENCKAVIVNTLYSQPFPVPVNRPTDFQAIFGHHIAKVSWERPYRLAGQGEGAWSAWSYRLTVEDAHDNGLFDFNEIKANQYTISSLEPGTEYVLRVAAYTFAGEGPWSDEFRGKTLHRNASLLWSSTEGLLLSDITGYRVTKIEPIVEADAQFIATDIDWYADEVFVTTHKRQVFWYNLTTNTHGRIHDINDADCISIEWLAKKLYWGSKTSKMIFRADLSGSKQEILPVIVAAESLFIDSLAAYIYWSTKNSVEGARLDGTEKKVFYASKNAFRSQILGLAVDIHGSELYWIEKTSAHPRQTALMILNVTNSSRNFNIDPHIDKYTLINQDAGGGLCYIDQHLVWVRNDDKNAMISGLNGTTTALIQSESLSNLITCTAVDPSLREISSRNNSADINVIPKPVTKSSIKIEGSFEAFNISWKATTNVNYDDVYYRLLIKIDNVDMDVNTRNTFVALRGEKAYVPLKITLQAYTFWSKSEPVRITLRSPSSTPSPPTDPRVFVTHKRKSLFQQKKEVSVLVRWSPPVEPNGIIKRYELSCFVTHNHTNSSGTTCSSSQISAKTLEFTLQNLPTNKIYNFQVRACNDYGCGNWSNVVRADFEEEIPVPKLLVISNEGLTKTDYDRKTFSMAIPDTKNVRDIFYEASRSVIYWIERENVYQSYLNLHLTNIKKLVGLKTNGICLSYDWIGRNLFWVEMLNNESNVNVLDLNRNEDERRPNVLFERSKVVKTILASPMNSILVWVELEMEKSQFGTLMKSSFDGTNVMEFFAKEIPSYKNDVSSSVLPTVEEREIKYDRCNSSKIGASITLYPSSQNEYGLLWFDVSTNYVMTTDLEAYNCKRVVQVDTKDGLPKSITADLKRVYWLDSDDITVYSIFINDPESEVEKVTASGGIRLKRILSYGSKLQFFPDTRCLWPHLKPDEVQVAKFSPDSIILRLPKVKKEKLCLNVSLATVEFTIYYGVVGENDTVSCASNLKVCSQVVTFDRVKKITKLKPFTRYIFVVGIGNYYSQLEGVDPIVGDAAIYRTSPGVPSPARNVTSVPCTPHSILVEWQPPEHFNAEAVGYSVLWRTKNGPVEVDEKQISRRKSNTSIVIEGLRPAQQYIIQVKTFAVAHRIPIPGIAYKYSANVSVQTYPLPGNLTLTNVTSSSLNLSFPEELRKFNVKVELYNRKSNQWELVISNSSRYILLEKLNPLTRYNVRLKIQYLLCQTHFTWTEKGFVFETLGDKPNAPRRPILNRIDENSFEIRWESTVNNGRNALIYELQGSSCNLEDASHMSKKKDKFHEWNPFYNGTNNSWITTSLSRDLVYVFRVRAKNEYGFGNFSENSDEYELLNNKYETIFLWSAIPLFGVGIVTVITTVYGKLSHVQFPPVYHCRKSKSKHEFAKNQIVNRTRADIIELINLHEIPAAKIINTNLLYTPRMDDQHRMNEEFSQIPRVHREQIGLTKFLGSGAFGEVYEGKVKNLLYANIDTKVAIKALRKNATEQEKLEFLKEALLMSNFKHKHILQLLGICVDNDPHFIIMELMEGGDLLSYLRSNRSTTAAPDSSLSYGDLLRICCDVASGCCYLEEMHFVHRDLACRNCLVSSKNPTMRIVKIGDFGLARDVYKNDYYRKKGEGLLPVRWMAPESLMDGVFTRHSDVWSFGVLLWEVMSFGQQPYQARSNVEVLQYVRIGGRLSRPSNCPPKLYKLMGKCWNSKPKERPTFTYCLLELEDLRNNCKLERLSGDYSNLVDCHTIDLGDS